jgi:HSP20 family protein
VNLSESGDQWRLECELPGVHKDDVDISVTGAQVVIKGEMKAPEGAEARSYHRSERRFGSFSRVIELPARADVEQMTAELRDGVLVMDIAKAPEARPRKIAVKGE